MAHFHRLLFQRDGGAPGHGSRGGDIRALAQRVEVDTGEVRIMGSKGALLRTLAAGAGVGTAACGVPTFVPKWRRERDLVVTVLYSYSDKSLILRETHPEAAQRQPIANVNQYHEADNLGRANETAEGILHQRRLRAAPSPPQARLL